MKLYLRSFQADSPPMQFLKINDPKISTFGVWGQTTVLLGTHILEFPLYKKPSLQPEGKEI